jgi:hypothetical protein
LLLTGAENRIGEGGKIRLVPPEPKGCHRGVNLAALDLGQQILVLPQCQRQPLHEASRTIQSFQVASADKDGNRVLTPLDEKAFPGRYPR